MRIDAFTIFPGMMRAYLEASIVGKAREANLIDVQLHDIRDYATDRHRTTDDVPYGGGGGMVMKAAPIFAAVEGVLGGELGSTPVILLTPQGEVLTQQLAREFMVEKRLALICGRYEGVDERVRSGLVTREISIGDYVLTGGELPALVLIDTIVRLIPGVLGNESATQDDSHSVGLLEHPHYTRPEGFRDMQVPEVLLSGNHAQIETWRKQNALLRTLQRRPDLLNGAELTAEQLELLRKAAAQEGIDWGAVKEVLGTNRRGRS
jgi:tRNA (guanine37-N1)-methyltransferase